MPSPSIYERCRVAALGLIDDPSLRPITTGPKGIWTELDVIMLAARAAAIDGRPFTDDDMDSAHKQANEAMGKLWRAHEVVRYGPVSVPEVKDQDYMRSASKMVYAGADGPESVTTPNGTFRRFFIHEDPIRRHGRRLGATRDDLTPWREQDIGRAKVKQTTPAERENMRLRSELDAAHRQINDLTQACERLREMNTALLALGHVSPTEVQKAEALMASDLRATNTT